MNQKDQIYKETTKPKKLKPKRDKSDLGPDFVAPDGGWGWVVCVAAGFSNVSIIYKSYYRFMFLNYFVKSFQYFRLCNILVLSIVFG